MKLSNVSCKYGAPMGRRSSCPAPSPGVRFHLNKVRINSGGYDSGGAYWGIGAPLWHAWSPASDDTEFTETFLRAPDRDAAKLAVATEFPGCTFHR